MPRTATLLALTTVFLWSFLAFLGARVSHLHPFLVVGIALCVSGLFGMLHWKGWQVSAVTMLVGVGGIFGYHFLYFSAFRYAPAVEANLINYLWPLFIVLLSPLYLPGHHLKLHHLAGAGLGLLGAGLIVTGGQLHLDRTALPGYLLMGGAALTWSSYSLLTKRLPPFSTAAVGAFCLVSGMLSLGMYALIGASLSPGKISPADWVALVLLGAGPMGAAFFTWDAALKRGDPRIIGSLAYLTPLTSTLVLVWIGGRTLSWVTGLAMVLIVSGALLGSLDLLRPVFQKQVARLAVKTPGRPPEP